MSARTVLLPMVILTAAGGPRVGALGPRVGALNGPEITIDIVNYFLVPDARQVLGIDYDPTTDRIYFCSNIDDVVFVCRASDGEIVDVIELTFDDGPSPFGVCYDPASDYLYVNDWGEESLRRLAGGEWSAVDHPSGREGRGLDIDPTGNYLFETYGYEGFYRFLPGGEEVYYPVGVFDSRLSGLTHFPYGGGDGVAFCEYEANNIYFYEVVGDECYFVGSAETPVGLVYYSLGLTYADGRDTFFWSCWDYNNVFWVYEFDIKFGFDGVKPASVGKVKAGFR